MPSTYNSTKYCVKSSLNILSDNARRESAPVISLSSNPRGGAHPQTPGHLCAVLGFRLVVLKQDERMEIASSVIYFQQLVENVKTKLPLWERFSYYTFYYVVSAACPFQFLLQSFRSLQSLCHVNHNNQGKITIYQLQIGLKYWTFVKSTQLDETTWCYRSKYTYCFMIATYLVHSHVPVAKLIWQHGCVQDGVGYLNLSATSGAQRK